MLHSQHTNTSTSINDLTFNTTSVPWLSHQPLTNAHVQCEASPRGNCGGQSS